ncbi:hypothetical protein IWX47DRAFT_861568 [Phyllosticta citricarpa]
MVVANERIVSKMSSRSCMTGRWRRRSSSAKRMFSRTASWAARRVSRPSRPTVIEEDEACTMRRSRASRSASKASHAAPTPSSKKCAATAVTKWWASRRKTAVVAAALPEEERNDDGRGSWCVTTKSMRASRSSSRKQASYLSRMAGVSTRCSGAGGVYCRRRKSRAYSECGSMTWSISAGCRMRMAKERLPGMSGVSRWW